MSRNYNPQTLEPEYNSLKYLNEPRMSLKLRDIIDRSIRGAPTDAADMTEFFDEDQPEDDWSVDRDYDDDVDMYEHKLELESKLEVSVKPRKQSEDDKKTQSIAEDELSD